MNQPNRTNMFTDFINNNPNMPPGINQRTRTNLINRLSGIPGMSQTIMPRTIMPQNPSSYGNNSANKAPQPGGSYKKYSKKMHKKRKTRKSRKSKKSRTRT